MAISFKASKISAPRGTAFTDWLYGTIGNDKLSGRAGDDEIYGFEGNDKLSGDAGDDYISGGVGNDNLTGGDGDDSIYGGLGLDKIAGGNGNDYIRGSDDDEIEADTLSGGGGHDTIDGGGGNDKLSGDAGDDYLRGGNGDDVLNGGSGDDNLYGGIGTDKLSGGEGNDYLNGTDDLATDILLGGGGKDTIAVGDGDSALGGSGIDTLNVYSYSYSTTTVYTIDLSNITGKKASSIGSTNVKAGQFEKAVVSIYGAGNGNSITGSKGDDKITVDAPSGTVDGGNGNDTIRVTSGTAGFTVNGGAGNDKIYADGGNNILIGGAGNDLFMLDHGESTNTILDFTAGDRFLISSNEGWRSDKIDMANFLVMSTAPTATSTKGQFLYDTDDGRLMYDPDGTGAQAAFLLSTLANKAALSAASFVFVF